MNDGGGFRIASYSAQKVLGTRRLAQLTATLEVDEDSATGNDPDLSDVRARLFVNGEPATPTAVVGPGRIHNLDVWFAKVNAAGLLNDAPLTLGCSTPELEYTSGVLDEFLLFTRALSPSDVRQLFLEMAGPRGPELARRELEPVRPLDEPPAIESLSQFGLQIGQTTRLRINGNRLAGTPRVDLPIPGVKQTVAKSSDNRHLSVDITVPADAPPGIYPLTVFTAGGVSNPMGIAVDGLAAMAGGRQCRRSARVAAGGVFRLAHGTGSQSRLLSWSCRRSAGRRSRGPTDRLAARPRDRVEKRGRIDDRHRMGQSVSCAATRGPS